MSWILCSCCGSSAAQEMDPEPSELYNTIENLTRINDVLLRPECGYCQRLDGDFLEKKKGMTKITSLLHDNWSTQILYATACLTNTTIHARGSIELAERASHDIREQYEKLRDIRNNFTGISPDRRFIFCNAIDNCLTVQHKVWSISTDICTIISEVHMKKKILKGMMSLLHETFQHDPEHIAQHEAIQQDFMDNDFDIEENLNLLLDDMRRVCEQVPYIRHDLTQD